MSMHADSVRILAARLGVPEAQVEAALSLEGLSLGPEHTQATTASRATLAPTAPPIVEESSGATEAPSSALSGLLGDRYRDLGPLGVGGMGEVRRVYDRQLRRVVAMKTLRTNLLENPAAVSRFIEEAEITAQLQHPGIIPIHDRGVLPDGRVWFTMREIEGRSFFEAIRDHHRAVDDNVEVATRRRRRLIESLHRVCAAVSHAHERGVVHRDLKPENIMMGQQGEILVVDWGLARVGRSEPEASSPSTVDSTRSARQAFLTQMGQVAGTPAYMSPEQADGALGQIGTTSDVYSLGVILYVILRGRTPFRGSDQDELLELVRGGAGHDVWESLVQVGTKEARGRAMTKPVVPTGLVEICRRAMQRKPADRFACAGALGEAIQAWLDGAQQRAEAVELVERALQQVSRIEALQQDARRLRRTAREGLVGLSPWAPVHVKAPLWDMEDRAARADAQASLLALEKEMLLHSSLTRVASLPVAHAALAALYHSVHQQTERRRKGSARVEALLRRHALALPREHPDRTRFLAYLDGRGRLSLRTDPPGATVQVYRYTEVERNMVPRDLGVLGVTPLERIVLDAGSYLCVVTCPGFVPVHYPLHIARQAHWTGGLPGMEHPPPLLLLDAETLGSGARYVPAGPMLLGDHRGVPPELADRSVWVDGFVIQTTPVTNAQYLEFLNDPSVDGDRWVPQERPNPRGEPGSRLLPRDIDGRFELAVDPDGDEWRPAMPVVYVDYAAACAYAQWLSRRSGQSWRLPTEIEWRKACQGVDGRPYPWGWVAEPTRAQNLLSGPPRQVLTDVGTFPDDCSPYGVLDMGGNCQEWTLDSEVDCRRRIADRRALVPRLDAGTSRLVCGASWTQALDAHVRNAPHQQPLTGRSGGLGFRLVRSVPA
ncbi:MAG: hypothetical protein CL927_18060 [Deltaproteobacteria bacterium]|nr:hypothetical protein [Deltaproteobacteria bacterium]